MKILKIAAPVVALIIIALLACSKETLIGTPQGQQEDFGKYSKSFTIYDELKENSITVSISSDNNEYIQNLTFDMVHFSPIKEEPQDDPALEGTEGTLTKNGSDQSTESDIHIHVTSENLLPGIIGYSLSVDDEIGIQDNVEIDPRASSWQTTTFYAYTPKTTMKLVNHSCQIASSKYHSKKYSWWLWELEGLRNLPANGGYWIFCRQNKYALKSSINYDASCGSPPSCTTYTQSSCSN